MTYYYLYKITNLVNNKIYVGVHKTKDLNDGYMGSGKIIRSAITKHGISNFSKDILEFFENAELMYAREKEVVTYEFLLREDTYNLRRGGTGGFDYINSDKELLKKRNIKCSAKRTKKIKTDPEFREKIRQNGRNNPPPISANTNRKKNAISKGISYNECHIGLLRTEETRQKISLAGAGKNNSQFGTMWITNGIENKKIKKDAVIPEGWSKGRKV